MTDMTQAPTPGPLSGDDVKLLVKGDLLRSKNGTFGTFLAQQHGKIAVETKSSALGGITITEAYFPDHWSFIGRPDADGWIPWSGGENPVPGQRVELRLKSGIRTAVYASEELKWSYRFSFRLAPTAPVEASGSEVPEGMMTIADELEDKADELDQMDARGQIWGLEEVSDIMRRAATALHPQPSGETREDDPIIKALKIWAESGQPDDAPIFSDRHDDAIKAIAEEGGVTNISDPDYTIGDVRRFLAALRPAPVASGGQHSSGEGEAAGCAEPQVGRAVYERIEKLIDAKPGTPEGDELSFLAFLVESVEEVGGYDRPPAAPVAKTAGEIRWTEDMERERREGDYERGFRDGQDATPSVPAQDDDKLRIAVEALEPFADIAGRYLTGGLRSDLEQRSPDLIKHFKAGDFYRARKARAALQQEG